MGASRAPAIWTILLGTFLLVGVTHGRQDKVDNAVKWAEELSHWLHSMFEGASKADEISKFYLNLAEPEVFDPDEMLRDVKHQIEVYLRQRAKMAWDVKVSLESKDLPNTTTDVMNNLSSGDGFVRYYNVKRENDGAIIYLDGNNAGISEVGVTREFPLRANPNFYQLPTSSDTSAVHVPTPIYNRGLELLRRIKWSDVDQIYRKNREHLKDLWFQKFCSESGFMRFFPAASWTWDLSKIFINTNTKNSQKLTLTRWDSREAELDLFDCRNTEWYVDAATTSKNVIVMLDTSGSMLGQRFEIARQTVEALFNTLSDNDFVNILLFSKAVTFLEDCAGDELVQATVRNKKLMLGRLANISAEGKADYEKALIAAFSTMMNLPTDPGSVAWRIREEVLRENAHRPEPPVGTHFVPTGPEHMLVISDFYKEKIRDYHAKGKRMGCEDIIVLITDGAPSNFKEIFHLYNKNKRIRMFSFVIGEEMSKDFEHIRWMSCKNRGFMSHIKGMGDVQNKMHDYAKVLSQTVSKQGASIHQENAVWSTSTRERMSDEFIVSVGYPVILEKDFMGVASTSVPLMELAQMAHPSLVGSRSHFFMLDKHGYALFHPQLRPIDSNTNEIRPTFNNIPFADLVQSTANRIIRPRIECDDEVEAGSLSSRSKLHLDTLFALDNLRRVYPQRNVYHSACLNGIPFTLALAVASRDNVRLKRVRQLNLKQIDLQKWFQSSNWRLHPRWRYCSLNDSDGDLSPEEGFTIYARQMSERGQLPEACRSRKKLVDLLLLDIEATSTLENLWEEDWRRDQKHGVHLAFFSTPSGLTRFMNQSLGHKFSYDSPPDALISRNRLRRVPIFVSISGNAQNKNESLTPPSTPTSDDASNKATISEPSYKHFVLELNRHSIEDDYYRRAVRQQKQASNKHRLVIELNPRTRLWVNDSDSPPTSYGHRESIAPLAIAYRAVRMDAHLGLPGGGPVLGVAGVEFLFDRMAEHLAKIGCNPEDERIRCYLLDEHAYVIYSSQKDTMYTEYLSTAQSQSTGASGTATRQRKQQQLKKMFADVTYAARWTQQQQNKFYPNVVMNRFFGQINRVTEWVMETLVKRGFYAEARFVDAQALCEQDPQTQQSSSTTAATTASSSATTTILNKIIAFGLTVFGWILGFVVQLSLFPMAVVDAGWSGGWAPVARTASLFRPSEGFYPCRQTSIYYLANFDQSTTKTSSSGALIDGHLSERPCKQSAAQCAVKVYASWVQDTNLMLVIVRQGARSQCYDEAHCPLSNPPAVPFGVVPQQPQREQQFWTAPDAGLSPAEAADHNETVFEERIFANCLISRPATKRTRPSQCLRDDFEGDAECSGASDRRQFVSFSLPIVITLLLVLLSIDNDRFVLYTIVDKL